MNKKDRAEEIYNEIRSVLFKDWDPVSVSYNPDLIDEYDSYIGSIYRLIFINASTDEIAEALSKIERDQIGFDTPKEKLLPVAEKLKLINVKISN